MAFNRFGMNAFASGPGMFFLTTLLSIGLATMLYRHLERDLAGWLRRWALKAVVDARKRVAPVPETVPHSAT